MLVGVVGKAFSVFCFSVCLFVWSITQKRMIPKCSSLVLGMTSGYPRSVMVFGVERLKVKVSVRVTVTVFHTNSRGIT